MLRGKDERETDTEWRISMNSLYNNLRAQKLFLFKIVQNKKQFCKTFKLFFGIYIYFFFFYYEHVSGQRPFSLSLSFHQWPAVCVNELRSSFRGLGSLIWVKFPEKLERRLRLGWGWLIVNEIFLNDLRKWQRASEGKKDIEWGGVNI